MFPYFFRSFLVIKDDLKFAISTAVEKEAVDVTIWVVLFASVTLIILVFIVICICVKKKFNKHTSSFSETHSLIDKINEDQLCEEVLFVYFRESKELADVVDTLREILTINNIKVSKNYNLRTYDNNLHF